MERMYLKRDKGAGMIQDQFTSQQQEQVIALFNQSKTQKEIAKSFGVPRRTMMKLCQYLGLHRNPHEAQKSRFDPQFVDMVTKLRTEGKTIEMIATITNRSTSAICRVLRKYDITAPPKDIDEDSICESYRAGAGMKTIADKLDISEYFVRKILNNHNVEIRPPLLSGGHYIKIKSIDLPPFEDSKEWFKSAYAKYGMSSIAKFVNRSIGYVAGKLKHYDIPRLTISDRQLQYDRATVVQLYNELGSMSQVAKRLNSTVQTIKNILTEQKMTPKSTSEIFSGQGNPFYGKHHLESTKQFCKDAGAFGGKKFWADHPEYIEIVKQKQKKYWSDVTKREEDSRRIAQLRKEGKCQSYKGTIETRFGVIPFDSSYEAALIEQCEKDPRVVYLERDFCLVEYQWNGIHHFVPDFRIWLQNGEFIVVEVKAKWYAKQPKERNKIRAGFGILSNKFMVIERDYSEVSRRIDLMLAPLEFEFGDVVIREISYDDYDSFYAVFHYMGRTGRRGLTYGAFLNDKLIACATIGSITRNEIATSRGFEPGQVRELARFCIHPDFHKKNFGSWFLSAIVSRFRKKNPDIAMLISFADTTQGHVGTIYKAANWDYDGDTGISYHYEESDGSIIHKKTIYDRARRDTMSETEYVITHNLIKVVEAPKRRYILVFRKQ